MQIAVVFRYGIIKFETAESKVRCLLKAGACIEKAGLLGTPLCFWVLVKEFNLSYHNRHL